MTITVQNLEELQDAAKNILTSFPNSKVFLFYGHMGAGKTTLINAICKQLGVTDHTSSPTFSIVNEYNSANGTLYHFDFYRLKSELEALDMGYEEYFYSGNFCFVEWPEKIANLIPLDAVYIHIESIDINKRVIKAEKK